MARSTKVTRTGIARTKQDWRCNFEDLVKVGDFCDDGIYQDFLSELPPVFNNLELLQLGEPSDHGPNGQPRYLTLQRAGLLWVFTGRRYLGEKVRIL